MKTSTTVKTEIKVDKRRQNTFETPENYKMSLFRKGRSQRVIQQVSSMKKVLRSRGIPLLCSKKSLRERLRIALVFDSKALKSFINKYVSFLKATLDVDTSVHLDYIISTWEERCLFEGPTNALKIFKDLYSIGLRISTSNTFKPLEFRKSTPNGTPKILGPIKELLYGTYNERKAALSVLSVLKLIEHHNTDLFDTGTIVKEGPIKAKPFGERVKVGNYFYRYIKQFGYKLDDIDIRRIRLLYFQELEKAFPNKFMKERLSNISDLSDIHISGRNGPNGPCLTTAIVDYAAMKQDPKSIELLDAIKEFSKMTNNGNLSGLMRRFEGEDPQIVSKNGKNPVHSKISLKLEPWGKVRLFAIVDYFSQSSMVGLHSYLFKWLEGQSEDGTFDQDRVSSIVQNWTKEDMGENSCESADLSAATDSVPVEIQGEILSQIAGSDFATLWVKIVADREFIDPIGNKIMYKTGQPMGILSSWAMLAVWHHIMARVCQSYVLNKRDIDNPEFLIIGDDIAMKGTRMFHIYEKLVSTIQGVGISKLKGFHKETQTLLNPLKGDNSTFIATAELAKRVFCNGREITCVPPKEVFTSLSNSLQFSELFQSLKMRGYENYNNTDKIPILARLCKNSSQALTLCTFPEKEFPLIKESEFNNLRDKEPYSSILWFKPNYDRDAFIRRLDEGVNRTCLETIETFTDLHHKWESLLKPDGSYTVKNWSYLSETQTLLLGIVLQTGEEKFSRLFARITRSKSGPYQKNRTIDWKGFSKLTKTLQTLIEVSMVFTSEKSNRSMDRLEFKSSFISKEVIKALHSLRFNSSKLLSIEDDFMASLFNNQKGRYGIQ